MVDGVIFDLDGTLWNPTFEILKCWQYHIPNLTLTEIKSAMGKTTEDISKQLDISPDLLNTLQQDEVKWLSEHTVTPYLGVTTLLQYLDTENIPCFIVSNCQSRYIECFLHTTGLGIYFKDWISYGDNGQTKTDNIKLIKERNNLTRPIYVGDTDADRVAAQNNGIKFVFASYGFGSVAEPCDATLIEPLDLVNCLRNSNV